MKDEVKQYIIPDYSEIDVSSPKSFVIVDEENRYYIYIDVYEEIYKYQTRNSAVGGIVGYFMWKNKIESVSVVTSQKEFDRLSKNTQHISFAKDSCNENTFTNLDFSRFSNLQSIEVGDNSLMYVKNVKIDGLSKLEKVKIGQNSFTEHRNGHDSNSQDNSFVVKNCDSLESLSIDRYSFSNYNSSE